MLEDVKKSLRITHHFLDDELSDIIEAARHDLMLSGVSSVMALAEVDVDPLIKRAIIIYAKAHTEDDKDQAARFHDSFVMLKQHLSLAADYQELAVE